MRPLLRLSAAALLALSTVSRAETPASDRKAVAIADQVMRALGSKQRWDALEGLRWSFGASVNDTVRSSRRHAWDKRTGWHRVEGKTRAGQSFCFIHKLNSTEGKAWMDGVAIEGDSLQKLLKRANSLWINDTYWMLMPYKLRDPGVTLKYDGETRQGGARYDKIALSFANVGDTPGDHYWVYVNRASHRVERWEMVLQGDQPPPVGYTWEGWEQHDGLWFATAHRKDATNVFTNAIETVKEFGPAEFSAP
ncbi:MAG TPA: hypothetical protein VGK89_10185 [Candidatus Eisenbacteria bacterium]|jgi:hypothetical protein